jgi:hypothetical protein
VTFDEILEAAVRPRRRLPGRQLDPEDSRAVVRVYQAACTEVIQCFEGYIAQYLCVDTILCAAAQQEGLSVINPETPEGFDTADTP